MANGEFVTWDINTEPGGRGPFAPPAGWRGDQKAYVTLMRERWKAFTYRQSLWACSQCERYHTPEFRGPFESEAKMILEGIKTSLKKKAV